MIPHIIHYCWFGKHPKSKKILDNIETWKNAFPNFQIIEWNEENTDLHDNTYIETAYQNKKWAFVSDFVRLKALYIHGGIYFDTDVEVLKPFPNELFELPGFSGFENGNFLVSPGLVIATIPGHEFVKKVLDSYSSDEFSANLTINMRVSNMLEEDGLRLDNSQQCVDGIKVFPSDFFCGYNFETRRIQITENTLSVHHYDASWFPWYLKVRFYLGTLLRRAHLR